MIQTVDLLILSNGPGELNTWVRPVTIALREKFGDDRSQVRISLILSPCPHATGQEVAIAKSNPAIDRVQAPEHFWQFLLSGKTQENWDWSSRGVVIFLGGDQFFTVVIGKRLGYRTVVYAEWDARWERWIDRFGVMKPEIIAHTHPKYANKFTVVGDLMAEVGAIAHSNNLEQPTPELIGLLVGSKPAKLWQGVPLCLAIAAHIHHQRPQTTFAIPVAATLDLPTLARFADANYNPLIALFGGVTAELITNTQTPYFQTSSGLQIELWTQTPAYHLLSQCHLCITTVGANTAELGSLGIPMIVLLSTHQLDAMRAWDGLPGLLANLPGFGSIFAKIINWFVLKQGKLFA